MSDPTMTVPWISGRWWKVIAPDGSTWCETSNEDQARGRMRDGDRLFRLMTRTEAKWEEIRMIEINPILVRVDEMIVTFVDAKALAACVRDLAEKARQVVGDCNLPDYAYSYLERRALRDLADVLAKYGLSDGSEG